MSSNNLFVLSHSVLYTTENKRLIDCLSSFLSLSLVTPSPPVPTGDGALPPPIPPRPASAPQAGGKGLPPPPPRVRAATPVPQSVANDEDAGACVRGGDEESDGDAAQGGACNGTVTYAVFRDALFLERERERLL